MAKKIIVNSHSHSLLPNKAYDMSFKKRLLRKKKGLKSQQAISILEDVLNDDVVNVWGISNNDVKQIKEKLEPSSIEHFSSYFLKLCLETSTDGVFFMNMKGQLHASVIVKGQIKMINSFKSNTNTDIVYFSHLLQDEFNESSTVFLLGDFDSSLKKLLKTYFKEVSQKNVANLRTSRIQNVEDDVLYI